MIADALSSQARLAAQTARLCGRYAVRRMHQSRLLRWRFNGPPVDRLLIAPQDLRTADPSFASEIYHGHFGLAGSVALTGSESPFLVEPPTAAWERALHGFGWLLHLRAARDEISREQARVLVRDWIELHESIGGVAWQPDILARRIVSWLSHSMLLLEDADGDFYEQAMESLARQLRYLRATYRDVPDGAPRLAALAALILAGLCTADHDAYAEDHLAPFAAELERQILADGGHISRSPAASIELLLDFLPLRQCFLARDREPPVALARAIDRMMPMLRFFRLGDGGLARFNGMGATPTDVLATVLAYDDVQGSPVSFAAQSGYYRAARGGTVLIADIGCAPPAEVSGNAHAGCLSFEMSSGRDPVIVNCGAPGPVDEDWRLAGRSTAAHNTLTFCETSSSRFMPAGLVDRRSGRGHIVGPTHVEVNVSEPHGILDIVASHDGYRARFGVTHTRRLLMSPNGEQVEGEDRVTAPDGLSATGQAARGAFVVRFHLHPSVRAQLSQDGHTALLVTPGHEGWLLSSVSAPLSIEESVFLADPRGPRRSQQVAIAGALDGRSEAAVTWTIEKSVSRLAQGAANQGALEGSHDELPLS